MKTLPCAPYLALIAAVLLAYANIYENEFLLDDMPLIVSNRFITSWHFVLPLFVSPITQGGGFGDHFYRPLLVLIYLILYQLFGLSTVAFHLPGVILHALNGCLLYTLGARLNFRRVPAFLAALLWALHPVQTEAVTFMSGPADLLCSAFLVAGITVLTKAFDRRQRMFACLLFALALLSKETAVIFPLLAMGLVFYQAEQRWRPAAYLKTWPFWLMAGLYLVLRATVLNFGGFYSYFASQALVPTSVVDRLYTFLATLPTYFRLLVWPAGLHIERSFPVYTGFWNGRVMAGSVLFAIMIAIVVSRPKRQATPMAWGLLWMLAAFIPQSGILVKADAPIFEHWLYLPTMGLAIATGESLARLAGRFPAPPVQRAAVALALSLAALCGGLTFRQNRNWHDPIAFYTHIFACGEDSGKARNELGMAYANAGDYDRAIRQFHLSMAFPDYHASAPYNLGYSLLKRDQNPETVAESIRYFEQALVLDPDFYLADDALADTYDHLGNQAKAADYRAKAAASRKKLNIK